MHSLRSSGVHPLSSGVHRPSTRRRLLLWLIVIKMSWDAYIDNLIAQSKGADGSANVDRACIIGLQGGAPWTSAGHANALKVSFERYIYVKGVREGGCITVLGFLFRMVVCGLKKGWTLSHVPLTMCVYTPSRRSALPLCTYSCKDTRVPTLPDASRQRTSHHSCRAELGWRAPLICSSEKMETL